MMELSPLEQMCVSVLLPIIDQKVNVGYKNAIEKSIFPEDMLADPKLLSRYKRAVANYNANIGFVKENKLNEMSVQQMDDICFIFLATYNDASKKPELMSFFGNSAMDCYKVILDKRIEKYGEPDSFKKYREELEAEKSQKIERGCFIATAVYGDIDHPQVLKLREFRDNKLALSMGGRWFIKKYYIFSPVIARKLINMPNLSLTIKRILDGVIEFVD